MSLINHWIGGGFADDKPNQVGDVYNPATGETAAQVAFADSDLVDHAVSTASEAFQTWGQSDLGTRVEILFRFRELVAENRNELARSISDEHGKVLSDAIGEVQRGQEVVEYACGIPELLKGSFSENVSGGVDMLSVRQPLGVVAGITPFNFPVMVPMWMYPIAVACGNTFVLKPSEKAPSAANLVAQLLKEAGLPDGVFNVVHGNKVAVDSLLAHPSVAAISSVGSTPVARYIYETAAGHGKRVQALGGAKNHMVVLADADLEAAADAAVSAAFGSTGQRCMAISALVVVDEVADGFLELLRQRVEQLKVGPAGDPDAVMGPLVTSQHRDKVVAHIESGLVEGATLAIDGRTASVPGFEGGFFLGPCVFDHVTPSMSVYSDEIFGPVLVMLRVAGPDEAIQIVNHNPYGNGTSIFTASGSEARRFRHEVEVGMVGINLPIPVPMAHFSFGGWKDSLFGDHHIYGPDGVRFYTRTKAVISRWSSSDHQGVRLQFTGSK